MTRETKIGLLVGMGVIILIGILISDHLSMAQRQQQARLDRVWPEVDAAMAPDPLVARAHDPIDDPASSQRLPFPGVVDGEAPLADNTRSGPTPGPDVIRQQLPPVAFNSSVRDEADPAPGSFASVDVTRNAPVDRSSYASASPPAPPTHHSAPTQPAPPTRTLADDIRSNPQFVVVPEPTGVSTSDRIRIRSAEAAHAAPRQRTHHVKDGERLSDLAKQYYGDPKLWKIIADANKDVMPNPDLVRAGVRLVIPPAPGSEAPAATAVAPAPAPRGTTTSQPTARGAAPTPPPAPATPQYDQYTVKPGEALANIAERYYGKQSAWRELYAINKDRIANPDRVAAGTVIRVPKRS